MEGTRRVPGRVPRRVPGGYPEGARYHATRVPEGYPEGTRIWPPGYTAAVHGRGVPYLPGLLPEHR